MNFARDRFSSTIAAAILAAVASTVTGCGIDGVQSASTATGSANIVGLIHGGPNTVSGAKVTLYATTTGGYGNAGASLASATSSANGSFSFTASSYTCPAGQEAYVVAAGGNTGGNTANNNSLLMAAIGPCANLTQSTQVYIDELSTVAAAYALNNFMSTTGSGTTATVGISAPANNNAYPSGTCTGVGAGMMCTAAGLYHAFQNAANLVNAVGTISALPTGQAYITPPSNPTTASTAAALQNVVPQQELNTLGNILQACVNSSGVPNTGTSACGTLFTNTTPSTSYAASPTIPTNTLQAMLNLAKYPFMGTANLFGIAPPSGYFQPTLTAAPPDFSVSIIYRSYGTNAANQIGAVYYTTTDINDNVYATALTAGSGGSINGSLPYTASALSSNGTGNWTAPASLLTSSGSVTYTCNSYAGTAATSGACFAAPDTANHLYVGLGSANFPTTGGLWQVSTTNGAVTTFNSTYSGTAYYPFALAVDRANDLFFSAPFQSSSNFDLLELPAGSTSTTAPAPVNSYKGAHLSDSLVFDSTGNLFGPLASGSNAGFAFFPNSGSISAESFTATPNQCNCLGTGTLGTDIFPTGGMVDGSGNYWMTGQNGIAEIGPSTTNSTTAAYDAQNATGGGSPGISEYAIGNSATTLRISSMDGAGTIFVPDNATSGPQNPQGGSPTAAAPSLRIFYTGFTGQTTLNIQGCNVGTATGSTTCITGAQTAPNSGLFYQAVNPAIDSTGSMWVSSLGNDAVIQVIGLAAPTWPQASYLHPGVMPQ